MRLTLSKNSLAVGILLFILLVTPLTAYILQQNQNPQSRAAVSGGTATVSMSPATATVNVGDTLPVKLYFNTNGEAVQIVTMRVTYSYSGSSPEVSASALAIDSDFLVNGNGDWTCSVQSIDSTAPDVNVDVSCANTNIAGFTSTSDVQIASFDLKATAVPSSNPLTVKFDPSNSRIRKKSDNSDILLTPTSQLALTVSGGGTPPPSSGTTHKICINSSCAIISGSGSDQCTVDGASCTPSFSATAAAECNAKYDPNCYNCVDDGEINILDFSCFRSAYGRQRTSSVNWQ